MKVLVIYSQKNYPPKKDQQELLKSFENYTNWEVYYLNFFISKKPLFISNHTFDILIFDYSVMYVNEYNAEKLFKLNQKIKSRTRIGFFQDEWFNSKLKEKLIHNLQLEHVFSVGPKSEIAKLYPNTNSNIVQFHQSLTGYIDEIETKKLEQLSQNINKSITIGYRGYYDASRFHFGTFYRLRAKLVELFHSKTKGKNLKIDVSNKKTDLIFGERWYEFLAKCKYVIGAESGVDLMDWDGSIKEKIDAYLKQKPQASYEETRDNVFKYQEGNIDYFAIAPRHFQACMTKTCQILIEGHYSGVLQKWKHYIPLKKDFSNIDEVIELVQKDDLRQQIVENAYKDIVLSGKYTYRAFVNQVIEKCNLSTVKNLTQKKYPFLKFNDWLSWKKLFLINKIIKPIYKNTSNLLPTEFLNALKKKFDI